MTDSYRYIGDYPLATMGQRRQQESSSAATTNTDRRKHMAYEDHKTVRNVEAQIYTVQMVIAAMSEAAEVGVGIRMML